MPVGKKNIAHHIIIFTTYTSSTNWNISWSIAAKSDYSRSRVDCVDRDTSPKYTSGKRRVSESVIRVISAVSFQTVDQCFMD